MLHRVATCALILPVTVALWLGMLATIVIFLPLLASVVILAKIYRPDLGRPVFGDPSVIFTLDLPQDSVDNLTHLILLDGVITTKKIFELFTERVLEKKKQNSEGELIFQRYRQTWSHFLGFSFWQAEKDFRPDHHMKEIYIQDGPWHFRTTCESDILLGFEKLAWQPWEAGKSPWELLVIQDYRTDGEPGKTQTAMVLRHHHGLIDGYGVASIFREFSGSAYTLPRINFKITLLTKILSYFRIPYDISNSIAHSQLPHLSKHFWCRSRLNSASSSTSATTEKETRDQLITILSKPIPTERIKAIKDRLGVSYLAVILTLVIRVYKRALEGDCMYKVPTTIPVLLPLPKGDHPGGTGNHFIPAKLALPLGGRTLGNSAKSHVLEMHEALRSVVTTSWPVICNLTVTLLGLLPVRIQKKIVLPCLLSDRPITLSSIPGAIDQSIKVDGVKIREIVTSCGPSPSGEPAMLVSGILGMQRVVMTAYIRGCVSKLQKMDKFDDYVEEELRSLFEIEECV